MHSQGSGSVITLLHALEKRVEIYIPGLRGKADEGHPQRETSHIMVDAKALPSVQNQLDRENGL
jgi:hypothetical protein